MAQGVGIGAAGVIGIAFEDTPGTYVAPTKFFPIRSETLQFTQETGQRRLLRGTADLTGVYAGNSMVGGDIVMEVYEDVLPYFLYASRADVAKTGSTNFTYVATGLHSAEPVDGYTLSITIVRNGIVFGYTGCVVGKQSYSLDSGLLIVTMSMVGQDEAVQSAPTPSYTTETPYAPGQYTFNIAGSAKCDLDTFTFEIDDAAAAEYRICQRAAKFVRWGERAVTASLTRDFLDRTDYDAFKAQTAQALELIASHGSNNQVQLKLPTTVKESYEVGLAGQTDLVRANISYLGTYDTVTSTAYKITVKTQEDITFS